MRQREGRLPRLQLGASRVDLVLPRPILQRQIEPVTGIALHRGRDVIRLARPVQVLRRDQLPGEQLLVPLEVALGERAGRARAREPGPELLDLLRAGTGQEVAQLGLGGAHIRLAPVHVRSVLGGVEAHEGLSRPDRVALIHEDRHDAARDLAADIDHHLRLDGPHALDRGHDVAVGHRRRPSPPVGGRSRRRPVRRRAAAGRRQGLA